MIGDTYVIEFNDDTEALTVTVANDTDVQVINGTFVIVYLPRKTVWFPWHRLSGVTLISNGKADG